MISVGPFSIRVVIIVLAAIVAWVAARLVARRLIGSEPYGLGTARGGWA